MATNKWKEFVDKNLFTSKDEFYELPYLSNSPQIKVDSLIEFSVTRHKAKEKEIHIENQYVDGVLRYLNIEEGLWILATSIKINKNIIGRAMYDVNQKSEHYFLSFSAFEYEFPSIDNISDESKKLLSKCWTFYKPRTEVATYFYNNTQGDFCNIVFTKEWAEKNLFRNSSSNSTEILNFLDEQTGFLTWLAVTKKIDEQAKLIWDSFVKSPKVNLQDLKSQIQTMTKDFLDQSIADNRIQNYETLKNKDYYNVARAEKIILQNLSEPFIGVDKIAVTVNLSPTKLKMIFKSVFGFSMLQYHKEKNLQLAEQLILNSDIQMKYISTITGYESASKFSANFKKRYGKLPVSYKKFAFP